MTGNGPETVATGPKKADTPEQADGRPGLFGLAGQHPPRLVTRHDDRLWDSLRTVR